MNYLEAFDILHDSLCPENYVEIGCREGISLARARCPSLAIDPDFDIKQALHAPTRIFRETSDAFFASRDLTRLIGDTFDLAFVDGMHNAEFALRDFLNLERHAGPASVIVIDDILPQDIAWTTRERQSIAWTGDVYKIIPLLRQARPDLEIEVFDIDMKGLAVIYNLSPTNTTLSDRYEEFESFLLSESANIDSIEAIRAALLPRPTNEFEDFASELAPKRKKARLNYAATNTSYLDLLKRSLLNEIYLDDELRLLYLREILNGKSEFNYAVFHDIRNTRREAYEALQASRETGRFPERNIHLSGFSHTMMGRKRLDSLHDCLDLVRENGVIGDLIECGVWRGGGCIFMAGYLNNYADNSRKVIVADSFHGLPEPSLPEDEGIDLSEEKFPELAVSQQTVQENFEVYGLLGEHIVFLEGWFKDTLKNAPIDQIALLRLDGDLYESTMDTLDALYDKVSSGGIVIADDYGAIPSCKQAISDFFSHRNEPLPALNTIDWTGVYWIKDANTEAELLRPFKSAFHSDFLPDYQAGVMRYTYRDVRCLKSPIDIAIYLKAIWDLRPRTIIEIGSQAGGSALLLADILDSFDIEANIYSIDLSPPQDISNDRIKFLQGDVCKIDEVFSRNNLYELPRPWFITEDSAHSYEGCMAALIFFSGAMVTGDLLAMEDGILDELGISDRYGGGPNRAIKEYLIKNPDEFEIVTDLCDMFGNNATYNPNGYLKKT